VQEAQVHWQQAVRVMMQQARRSFLEIQGIGNNRHEMSLILD